MKKFFFCLLFISGYGAFSQTDSVKVVFDTVYQEEKAVVIKQEHYLPVQAETVQDIWWFLSAGYMSGKNLDYSPGSDVFKSESPGVSGGFIHLGCEFHKLSLGVGLSVLNANYKAVFNNTIFNNKETQVTIIDTVDQYTETVGDIKTTYYTLDTLTGTVHYNESKDSSWVTSLNTNYIQIPVLVRYLFTKNKWTLAPGLGLTPCFVLNKSPGYANNQTTEAKNFFLLGVVHLSLSRALISNLSAEAYSEYAQNLTVVTTPAFFNYKLLSLGFRINYFF